MALFIDCMTAALLAKAPDTFIVAVTRATTQNASEWVAKTAIGLGGGVEKKLSRTQLVGEGEGDGVKLGLGLVHALLGPARLHDLLGQYACRLLVASFGRLLDLQLHLLLLPLQVYIG
jgi:hypothetical protein